MFKKVLFPTDFSEYAQRTFECIDDLQGVEEVILLHVVDAAYLSKRGLDSRPYIEKAIADLEKEKERFEDLGLKIKLKVDVITNGDVPRAILETVNKENVSLVVMGARGKSLIEGILLGSVAKNVLRYGNTHVLIMRYKLAEMLKGKIYEKFCPRIFSKVLFPTDFSEPAEKALSFVKNLKGIEEIVLVHVVDRGETREEIEANVLEAKKRLEAISEELGREGMKAKVHVRVGSPPEEINSVAEEENVSLIAMSTHGMGLFRELLLGSTARDVFSQTERPVLALRTREYEKK